MQSLLQFPFIVRVEVVALETRVEYYTVLVSVAGREGVAAFLRRTADAEVVLLLYCCT